MDNEENREQTGPRYFDIDRFIEDMGLTSPGHDYLDENGSPTGEFNPENMEMEIANKISIINFRAPKLGSRTHEALQKIRGIYANTDKYPPDVIDKYDNYLREQVVTKPNLTPYLEAVFPNKE